jgi:hypothetical protein
MSKKLVDRNKEMHRLRFEELLPLSQIGKKFGVTRERVRQILGNTGNGFIRRRHERQILSQPEKSTSMLAKDLGLNNHTIYNYRANTCYKKSGNPGICDEQVNHISDKLYNLDIDHIKVCKKLHYHIVIYPNIKISVRVATKRWEAPSLKFASPAYRFRVHGLENVDFIIFVIAKTEDFFIVPQSEIFARDTVAFCWPCNNTTGRGSPYRKYHERWDLLQQISLEV